MRRTYLVCERRFDDPSPPPLGPVTVRWHRREDEEIVVKHHAPREYLDMRFAAGARLAVAEIDGELVGWRFFQAGIVTQNPCYVFHLPANAIVATTAFVRPEFRGRRVYGAILEQTLPILAGEGYRRVISVTTTDNVASQKAHAAVGEVPIITIDEHRILGLRFLRVDGRPQFGFWSRHRRFPIRVPPTGSPV